MGLISNELNEQLNQLIGKCFAINRMLDRGMSLLKIRWKLSLAADILHPKVAHAYPGDQFADSISEYQAQRDMESIYPETPIGNKEYGSPLEFFQDFHRENLEFQDMIQDAMDQASDEGDRTTKKFLSNLLYRLVPFSDLSQTLVDVCSRYGNDSFHMQVFDSVIEKYVKV